MAAFSDAIADCRLSDLGFRGLPFTWDNRQEAERNVKARLDRALGDEKFLEVLSDCGTTHPVGRVRSLCPPCGSEGADTR